MELKQALGNTWYLEADELIPLYRLPDGRCILLDSGLKTEEEGLFRALEDNGLTPVGVFGSHAHIDHWGNAYGLRARYGTRLALPEGEAAITACPELLRGLYGNLSPAMFQARYGHLLGRVDQTVGQLDGPVEFCGVSFQVLHTPGHSPDHICTITPDGVCYLADAAFTPDFLAAAKLPYHADHGRARACMEKLRGLDCPVYLSAHRGMETGLDRVLDANLARLDQVGETLLALVEGTMTFDGLCQAALARLQLLTTRPDRSALYARNLRCFLDELLDRGALAMEVRTGVRHYRRT